VDTTATAIVDCQGERPQPLKNKFLVDIYMSKCKNPQEKKALSLKRDRRNRYGENSKSSRKNIPRGKQRSHQRERRAVIQNLTALSGSAPDVSLMNTAESAVKTAERQLKRRRFKKTADVSLAEAIEDKRFRRTCALEHEAKMRTRIMYIESKALSLNGPARIGRVSFSKRGGTVYYNGRSFQRLKGSGFKANYFDTETSEPYWISGPRTDGEDRLYAGGPPVAIDDDVWDEYWSQIRKKKPPQKRHR
jgi:hypothetical protein